MKPLKTLSAIIVTFLTVFILTTLLSMLPPAEAMMSSMLNVSRDPEAYASHIMYLLGGHFIQSAFFVSLYIYTGQHTRTVKHAAGFGALVGLFLGFTNMALYSMLDIQLPALIAWSISDVINFTTAGVLIGLILKHKPTIES